MEDISRLSEQLHKLDVCHVVPTPPKSAFSCSVVGGNPIVPNNTTQAAIQESRIRTLTKSSRDTNPFYDPNLNFEAAAKYLHKILHAALQACDAWLKVPVDRVLTTIEKSNDQNPFICMCHDFNHILFFLEHGRHGFDLTFLPDNFFADVESLVPGLLIKVEQLSEIEGCAFLYDYGVVALRDLKVRLIEIQDLRKRIWLQTKEAYERQHSAEGVANAVEGRVILPLRKKGKTRSSHITTEAGSLHKTRLGLEVNTAFTEKQEVPAGGDLVSTEGAECKNGQDVSLEEDHRVKAGKETTASRAKHEGVCDDKDSESVPSADPRLALFVEEELELKVVCEESVMDQALSEDDYIEQASHFQRADSKADGFRAFK